MPRSVSAEVGQANDLPYPRRGQVLLGNVGAARPGGSGERRDGEAVLGGVDRVGEARSRPSFP